MGHQGGYAGAELCGHALRLLLVHPQALRQLAPAQAVQQRVAQLLHPRALLLAHLPWRPDPPQEVLACMHAGRW